MATKKTPPWDKPNPSSPRTRKTLSPAQKKEAEARADAAGRPYPNLVDNMAVAKKTGGKTASAKKKPAAKKAAKKTAGKKTP